MDADLTTVPRAHGRPPAAGKPRSSWRRLADTCGVIAASKPFQWSILAVIVANAVAIGVETYPGIADQHGGLLERLEQLFLTVFVVEIVIRLLSYGLDLRRFFGRGWNIFDFAIVAASFVPGIAGNVTLLRVVRVLRVIRLIEAVQDLRVIAKGLLRSLTPLAGVATLVVIVTYIYAVLGNVLFGDELPEEWGTVGSAMLSCFQVLTLDNWDDIFFPAQEVTPWAVPYFLSFILIATFVVLNIVIAVVVSSVEQARQAELAENVEVVSQDVAEQAPELADRIVALRAALDDLEGELRSQGSANAPSGASTDGNVSGRYGQDRDQ